MSKVKRKGKGKGRRIEGITRAARDLGVSHSHLWRVLTGERRSFRLEARYAAWRAADIHNKHREG